MPTELPTFSGSEDRIDLETWIPTISPLAYDLERLAPNLAGFNSPNPDIPGPHIAPVNAPVSYPFQVWSDLTERVAAVNSSG